MFFIPCGKYTKVEKSRCYFWDFPFSINRRLITKKIKVEDTSGPTFEARRGVV